MVKDSDNFAKYFVIHSTDEKVPISSKSVFRIAKSLENAVGPDYKVKKLSSGDLLIEVFKKTQSDQLEKLEMVADQTVTVTPHRSLNSTQGVISEKDLINETDEDILENLRPQGVTAVRRCQYSFADLALALAPCERPTASTGPSALNMKPAQQVAKATREPTLSKPSLSAAGPSDEVSGASPVVQTRKTERVSASPRGGPGTSKSSDEPMEVSSAPSVLPAPREQHNPTENKKRGKILRVTGPPKDPVT
ncbi:hypothetical protein HPB50_013193 [Hyalomma asiaticum]|uniref:Uncharacterized protein n=1 Tax=Hyalomma asiaticum TaxID=266040 RepID=A0ACB7SGJ2_HYAAI|nr:hypothetical protein HPB50_013193 [Hyalomma asiaticum]